MAVAFSTEESVVFVGGRGTKAGDADAGGGCTKELWGDLKSPNKSLSDIMDTTGEPVSDASAWGGSANACVVSQAPGGPPWKVLVTKAGAFANVIAGLIANVKFGIHDDGRYRVNSGNLTDDTIEIELEYDLPDNCDVKVGGAFNTLQVASDETDANAYTVHILTNKQEVFGAAAAIDIDTGGGNIAANTYKRIIGIDDDGVELEEEFYNVIDGNGRECHVFNIVDVNCIEFRHIYAKDAGTNYSGFYLNATESWRGALFKYCKSTGCKMGIHSVYTSGYIIGPTIIGGYYTASSYALRIESRAGAVLGALLEKPRGGSVVYFDVYGPGLVFGCVFKGNGTANGIYNTARYGAVIIRNCVFYDVGRGIRINHNDATLIEDNNIYVVHDKDDGLAIKRDIGTIIYSDYSCLWALDGTPSTSGRWGGDGKPEHAIEEDPDLIDAANGNFRPRKPNVLRGGKPDIAGNATEMGAVLQEYEFARRAKAANLGRLQIIR